MMLHEKPEYFNDFRHLSIHAHVYNFNLTTLRMVLQQHGFRFIDGSEIAHGVFMVGDDDAVDGRRNAAVILEYLQEMEMLYGSGQEK
jgi:hypothetical protein